MTEHYKPEIIGLKFLDIFVLTGYYVIFAILIATFIDEVLGKYSSQHDEEKSTARLLVEAILFTFLLVITFYVVRNIVERIPFPFDGMYGFKHSRVKERSGDVVFVFILFYYQDYYVQKLKFLKERLSNLF